MSITIERNGELVKLETFSNKDVVMYLMLTLNADEKRFKVVATPKFCNGIMAKFDDVDFIIYARNTCIELSFDKTDAKKMSYVIEKITKWDKFSKTEQSFYVEINERNSRTVIFENGYKTCGYYRRLFSCIKVATF